VEGLLEVGAPVVIVDPHGEYGSLMHPNTDAGDLSRMHEFGVRPEGFSDSVVEYAVDQELNIGALPIRFSERGMDPVTLLEMSGMRSSGPQLALLASAVEMLRAQGIRYNFDDIIEVLHGDRAGSRWNVINALVGLQGSGLFSDHPTDPGNLVRPGQCTVINLRGLGPDIANIAVAMLMKVLFEGRVYNVSVQGGQSVIQILVRECPKGTRCSLWVTYPADTDATNNSWVRVLGTVQGQQQFRSENERIVTVPKVSAEEKVARLNKEFERYAV